MTNGILSATGSGSGSTNLTLAGENYLNLNGQTLTAGPIDLSGTNATGILNSARFPALSGDVTTNAGSTVTTLKNVGTPGTYYSVTTDAKGRVISGNTTLTAGEVTISPISGISGTTVQDALSSLKSQIASASGGGLTSVAVDGTTIAGDGTSTSPLNLKNKAVSFAKMADIQGPALIGRSTADIGSIPELPKCSEMILWLLPFMSTTKQNYLKTNGSNRLMTEKSNKPWERRMQISRPAGSE